MKERNPLSRLLVLKGGFVDILLIAVALGLSVGIFGSVAIELFKLKTVSTLILSIASVLMLVIFLAHRILSSLERTIRYEGTLTFQEADRGLTPLEVENYKIPSKVSEYLGSAFTENPALKNIWDKKPIVCMVSESAGKELNSNQLVKQAIEYALLDQISMDIQAYFAENNIDQSVLKGYSREDLPDFLLGNKFFDLFTKPMDERALFVGRESDDDRPGKVVWATGEDGAIFNHFELTLPEGSSLKRAESGAIILSTKVFELSLNPRFEGFSSVWPSDFEKLYIGINDWSSLRSYQFNLDVEVKFNQLSLLIGRGWEYYSWLDSLIEQLEGYVDDEKFLKDIGWATVYTSHVVSKNQPPLPNKSGKKDAVSRASS